MHVSALNTLPGFLVALSLWGHVVHSYYMPPPLNYDAVPGPGQNVGVPVSGSGNGSALQSPSAGVFDLGNHTSTAGSGSEIGSDAVAPHSTEADKNKHEDQDGEAPTGTESATGMSVLSPRDVWSAAITYPDASTVWTVGSEVTVTWSTADRPKHVTNYAGKIVLGHLEDGDDSDEHLDYNHPLASGFNLTQGHARVRVPDVPASNDYIIVLFGDSGNRSARFTIVQ